MILSNLRHTIRSLNWLSNHHVRCVWIKTSWDETPRMAWTRWGGTPWTSSSPAPHFPNFYSTSAILPIVWRNVTHVASWPGEDVSVIFKETFWYSGLGLFGFAPDTPTFPTSVFVWFRDSREAVYPNFVWEVTFPTSIALMEGPFEKDACSNTTEAKI